MLSPVPLLDELNIRRLGIFFGATIPIAFALNYVWEIAQCRLFFIHGTLPPTQLAMLGATAGDVVLTGIAYLGVAAVSRRLMWPLTTWSFRTWLTLEIFAFFEGTILEAIGLSMGRWAYTVEAPLVPGTHISIVPLLQLALLLPLSFWLGLRIAKCFKV